MREKDSEQNNAKSLMAVARNWVVIGSAVGALGLQDIGSPFLNACLV